MHLQMYIRGVTLGKSFRPNRNLSLYQKVLGSMKRRDKPVVGFLYIRLVVSF